jgi:HK97 family phage major capsid protein
MSWMPYEASFEPVPADPSVGVGRAAEQPKTEPPAHGAPVAAQEQRNSDTQKEKQNMDPKVMAMLFTRAAEHGIDAAKVRELIDAGKGAAELDAMIVDKQRVEIKELQARKPDASAQAVAAPSPVVGLTQAEAKRYSFLNALRYLSGDSRIDIGFERECSDAVSKKIGRAARGLFVPYDVQIARRDLQITGGGTGANFVATNLMASDFITAMRNAMALPQLGVTMMTGLVGDIAIPKGAAATGYWIAETATPTESSPTLSQVTGSPNTVGATIDISRKLLLQSSVDVEAYVRNEIAVALGQAIDAAAFNGAGGAEPTGLLTGPISTDVTMTAGSVAYADMCSLVSTVTGKNAQFNNLKFAVTNEVFWKLAATATSTNGPLFIADYNTGKIMGRPAVVSENVTANYGFVADWSYMILAMWGNGLDLTVDPYSGSKSGLVSVTGFMDADVLIKDANAFAHADITT